MMRTNVIKTLAVMVIILMMCNQPVVFKAKAADEAGPYNFHYCQLNNQQQDIYDQIEFFTYEEDPTVAYAIIEADFNKMTVEEINETLTAYNYDNLLFYYAYSAADLELYDLSAYSPNSVLVKVPVTENDTELYSSFIDYAYLVADYYSDTELYSAIKTVLMTVIELAEVADINPVRFFELGLEVLGVPCITAFKESGEVAGLTYLFFNSDWYAVDWGNLEVDDETGAIKHFLLSKEEVSASVTNALAYEYPELADDKYLHKIIEINYSLESRELREGEVVEEVPFFHLYLFGSFEAPSPYWNVPNAAGEIIPFSSAVDMWVPLLDFQNYTVGQVSPYNEVIDVIRNYTGVVIARTPDTWYQEGYVQNMTAFVHSDRNTINGFKYTYCYYE